MIWKNIDRYNKKNELRKMTYRVKANPKMIKWARLDAGYSFEDLPQTLKNAPQWESGDLLPTWNDLRNLADKYKRPPVFYLMDDPPEDDGLNIVEFRSDEKIENFSPQLRLEIRKAKYRRNILINLSSEMSKDISDFSKNLSNENNPEKLARKVRKFLNISFETQQKWLLNSKDEKKYDHSIFLYEWKELLSDLGILIFETEKVDEKEMSGLCLYYDKYPIIILNGKNKQNRRIFTIMHELTHLFGGRSAICDVDEANKKEAFCNKVAAEILVPHNTLSEENIYFKNGNVNYSGLSHLYGVSQQVIVYRLSDLKIISKKEKIAKINDIKANNQRKKEKELERAKKSEWGSLGYVSRKKKYEGEFYSRFILNAYENNIISSSKLMRYLDFPIEKIESLYEELFG